MQKRFLKRKGFSAASAMAIKVSHYDLRMGTGTRGRAKQTWDFPSTSGGSTHKTILWSDNTVTCDCYGWLHWRRCWHKELIETEYLQGVKI